jgi:dCMP deaminase
MSSEYTRPGWDEYFTGIVTAVAARADCRRGRYGAVIVRNNRIVSTGYNGSVPGGPSCLAGFCPRGLQSKVERPSDHGNPAYDSYADCISLHAEQNAIAFADVHDTVGATIYISAKPCDMCAKLIAAAGITRTVYPHGAE